MSFELYTKRLDIVDEVHEILLQDLGGSDVSYFNLLSEELPTFAVTGAESSGKSTLANKISGTRLPVKEERCTKLATILKLRHGQVTRPVEVDLLRPTGNPKRERFEDVEVDRAILKAQEQALRESDGTSFAENHFVEVSVVGQRIPNLTLIDLPGFTSQSQQHGEQVRKIVEKNLQRKGTLILQVVKSNMLYTSVLGNDFLETHGNRCTNVFTYWDKFETEDEASKMNWMDCIIKSTSKPRFAILGKVNDRSKEIDELASLTCFQGEYKEEFEYGTDALIKHLQTKLESHFNTQLPKCIHLLESELEKTNTTFRRIEKKNPIAIVADIFKDLSQSWKQFSSLKSKFGNLRESLGMEIRNTTIQIGGRFVRNFQSHETIEIGTEFFHRRKKSDERLTKAVILGLDSPKKAKWLDSNEEFTLSTQKKDLVTTEDSKDEILTVIKDKSSIYE